jgi:signal transduction histidine kinase
MRCLVEATQQLSLARHVDAIAAVVRSVARILAGADGATFVLRDADECWYVDEDAIGPLWKGQRFPMSACVSGWAMLNRKPAVIPDIFDDPRVPVDAYRSTFVKSLVMVPIRTADPIGAIGVYWSRPFEATSVDVDLLQSLANTTSVAMENVAVHRNLERLVAERTKDLSAANEELEAFSYSVSHDLRNPLASINGHATLVEMDLGSGDLATAKRNLETIRSETFRMAQLIDDLLRLSSFQRAPLAKSRVDLSAMAERICARLRHAAPERRVLVHIQPSLLVRADPGLIEALMENLLSNAWKFTSKREEARISVTWTTAAEAFEIAVRDNGAGFDRAKAEKLFTPFSRMHSRAEFPGTGIGLALCRRIVERHGGTIRAESAPDQGATFAFTLPLDSP